MFDEWKIKSLLKKDLSREKYEDLSYRIQCDSRVVAHLIKCDPSAISIVDRDVDISTYVLADYSLIKYLTYSQLNSIIDDLDLTKVELTKEVYSKLSDKNKLVVFNQFPLLCLDLMKPERRIETIYDIIFEHAKKNEGSDLYKLFSSSDIEKILLSLDEKDFNYLLNSSKVVINYVSDFILSLEKEQLMNLYDRCPGIFEYLPEDSKDIIELEKVGDDIGKINSLSENAQYKFYMNNKHLLYLAPEKIIRKCVDSMDDFSIEHFIMISDVAGKWTDLHLLPKDELDKALAYDLNNVYWYCYFHHDRYKDHLQMLVFDKLSIIPDVDVRKRYMALYNSLELEKILPPKSYGHINGEKYQISKLLLDEKIILNNSPEIIEKYRKSLDKKLLIDIISNAYGPHVKNIFVDRPNLGITEIDNLSIFSKDIYEVLGKGFIDYALNCDLRSSNYLIYLLANDRELLNVFNSYFKEMTKDIEKLDLNTITNLCDKFLRHRNVFKDVDFDNLSEERRNNINILLSDRYDITIHVQSVEYIDNYIEIRNKRFMDLVDTYEYADDVRDGIFAYVTGRDVRDKSGEYNLENLTLEQVIKTFDIDRIIDNEELIEKMNLNKDDISILLLLNEINHIGDVEVLKNTFKALISRGMDSRLLTSTFDKIKKYCCDDVKADLLSSSKLESKVSKVVDGIDVVTLDGDSFSTLISVTGVNLSDTGLFPTPVLGEDLLNSWLYREGGLVTISTSLVSSDTSIYPASKKMWAGLKGHITFVFDNDVNIVGMGGSDISSSHVSRSKKHAFNFIESNDFGFSPMADLKRRTNKNIRENTLSKFDNEVTISRFKEDIRKEDSGKRVMPIGVYVVGEITPEVIETAKTFNKYYEEHGLGKFRIIQVDPKVYRGEGRIDKSISKSKGEDGYGKGF